MGNLALHSAEEPYNLRATTRTVEVPTERDNDAALVLGARPVIQHQPAARHKITAGPAESNVSPLPGIWRDSLHVTCGLTACTLGSAPGPTLGNEYGKTLPFYVLHGSLLQLLLEHGVFFEHRYFTK